MSIYRPVKIPSEGVDAPGVAVATSVQLRRAGQATGQAAGTIGAVRTITSSTFIASTDTMVQADTTAGAVDATLPRISEYSRMMVYTERYDGVNTYRVLPRGADTINGGADITVTGLTLLFPRTNSDWRAIVLA